MIQGISALTLGTAALVQPYAGLPPPTRQDALRLVLAAVHDGVTMIDTAPSYGSEELVGIAASGRPKVMMATKISPHLRTSRHVWHQLGASRAALGRDCLDVVQLHNATATDFSHTAMVLDVLREAQAKRQVRWVGASVYAVDDARAALRAGVDVVQIAYNLLDQRIIDADMVRPSLVEQARRAGVILLGRSPWLRGALAGGPCPPAARQAAQRARRVLLARDRDLPRLALRFALQGPASVIVGVRTVEEWTQAARWIAEGHLPIWRQILTAFCASDDPAVIDPRRWPVN